MSTGRVIPTFNELEDCHAGLGREAVTIEEFALQGSEEAFAQGVVVAITGRTHRGAHTGLLAASSKADRGILRALIGMVDDSDGPSLQKSHLQSIKDKLGLEMGGIAQPTTRRLKASMTTAR